MLGLEQYSTSHVSTSFWIQDYTDEPADILFQWTQMGWKVFPPHRWVAFAVLFWGTVSSVQAACTSWEGLMVCRFLLAIPEAMYGPAVPLYLSFFYPRERLGLRVGLFLSGSALANAYGGALAYGISQAHGAIHPWKILFLVEGMSFIIWLKSTDVLKVYQLLHWQSSHGSGSRIVQEKPSF
jgi:MFS family permease